MEYALTETDTEYIVRLPDEYVPHESRVQNILLWIMHRKPGKYPLKDKYKTLSEFSFNKKLYGPKTENKFIMLSEDEVFTVGHTKVKITSDMTRELNIEAIKIYMEIRNGFAQLRSILPDVHFSSDFQYLFVKPIDIA